MGTTQKSCTFFLALKGRNIPAQGNALGKTLQWAHTTDGGSIYYSHF